MTQTDSNRVAAATHAERLLWYAALFYLAGLVIHTVDHQRRGLDVITDEVFWAGIASSIAALTAIALVMSGHRLGALAAFAIGIPAAIGVSVVHLAPHWSAFSDSLPEGSVDTLTWVAVAIEIVGAAAFGAAGLNVLRNRGLQLRRA